MRVTVDTSEAKSFELVEPGPYEMTIRAVEFFQGKPATDNSEAKVSQLEVEFAFQDPRLDQSSGTIKRRYPIEGKGAGFFRDFWKAATGEDIPVGQKLDVDTDAAIGRPVIVAVEHREYNGKKYNEAKQVTSAS